MSEAYSKKTEVFTTSAWVCCQIGAREYYEIPRALYRSGQLRALITDQWVPQWLPPVLPPFGPFLNLKIRQLEDLSKAPVYSHTVSSLLFEAKERLKGNKGWLKMIARNKWFQAAALPSLEKIAQQAKREENQPVLFTYSYAALELLRFAKKNNWLAILGQIDGGPFEEEIVKKEYLRRPELNFNWQPPPKSYWDDWRKECELADHIIVNSNWSKECMEKSGAPLQKMHVIPLVYEPSQKALNFKRQYPDGFNKERPLRLLFLGQLILRKGIAYVLEAAKMLEKEAVEFWLVGSSDLPKWAMRLPNVKFFGAVDRASVNKFYKNADIFLFPTLSDGFGLTQLEAQAWRLPVIASRYCGEVTKGGVNGILLEEVNTGVIVETVKFCLGNPSLLQSYSNNPNCESFSINALSVRLKDLVNLE